MNLEPDMPLGWRLRTCAAVSTHGSERRKAFRMDSLGSEGQIASGEQTTVAAASGWLLTGSSIHPIGACGST